MDKRSRVRKDMERLLLKPEEVAILLSIGKSKTYQLLAAGILPSVHVGASLRVPADALREWVRNKTRSPRDMRKQNSSVAASS